MSKRVICKVCGETKPHAARGMCNTCYKREHSHKTGRYKPMSENKSCASYLGVYVAERVLAKVFKDIEVMPPNHPGYDFLCGKGYKIDVKSACLDAAGRWLFRINHNTTADYFLCIAFNDREDLTPIHLWLLPGGLVNHLTTTSVSPNTLEKWRDYELDINNVRAQCDLLRE